MLIMVAPQNSMLIIDGDRLFKVRSVSRFMSRANHVERDPRISTYLNGSTYWNVGRPSKRSNGALTLPTNLRDNGAPP
jgi:hypothetical protein